MIAKFTENIVKRVDCVETQTPVALLNHGVCKDALYILPGMRVLDT